MPKSAWLSSRRSPADGRSGRTGHHGRRQERRRVRPSVCCWGQSDRRRQAGVPNLRQPAGTGRCGGPCCPHPPSGRVERPVPRPALPIPRRRGVRGVPASPAAPLHGGGRPRHCIISRPSRRAGGPNSASRTRSAAPGPVADRRCRRGGAAQEGEARRLRHADRASQQRGSRNGQVSGGHWRRGPRTGTKDRARRDAEHGRRDRRQVKLHGRHGRRVERRRSRSGSRVAWTWVAGAATPAPAVVQAMRTEIGRPSSSMRLSAWTATSTSVARRSSVRERNPSPITCLNLPTPASARARFV